jgi:2'-5' RNA ligase
MATEEASFQPRTVSIDSHDTALCIIPPKQHWSRFDRLRSLYDKAYEKWPPHINIIYPFVQTGDLSMASALAASQLKLLSQSDSTPSSFIDVCLNAADVFPHKHNNTIFVYDESQERTSALQSLRQGLLRILGHTSTTSYRPHMTIGQSQDLSASSHRFLLEKASLLPTTNWAVDKLYILVRERMVIDGNAFSQMKVWGSSK